jgi:ATP-dependent Clp protease ATP-binding subunit ClpC
MELANQEAQRFNHEYIGPEHILLGLVMEGSGVAANVLKNLDVDPSKVRLEVEKIGPSGPERVSMGKLPEAPRAKKVIEYAVEEARNLNHNSVGTEHLLLGILREQEGVAAQILMNLGMNLENVREETISLIGLEGETSLETETSAERVAAALQKAHKSKIPTLDEYGCGLTDLARAGKLDPPLGYFREIKRTVQILSRRESSNPLLIGAVENEARQIAEAVAQLIVEHNVPQALSSCQIVEFDMALLVARHTQEQFKKLIIALIGELQRAKSTILFVENIGSYLSMNPSETNSAAPLLRLALTRGDIRCIGATTTENYRTTFLRDPLLGRQFQSVEVEPLSPEETLRLLQGARDRFEVHHRLQITDDALAAAVRLSELFLPQQAFPAKARNLVDEAATELRLHLMAPPPDLRELEEKIERLNVGKEEAVANQDFETAAGLRDQADKLKKTKEQLMREFRTKQWSNADAVVDEDAVVAALSRISGIPEDAIRKGDTSAIPLPPAIPQEGVSKFERDQCSSILQGQGIQIVQNTSVVLMPYRKGFERVLEDAIRPALLIAGFGTRIVSDNFQPGLVANQVWEWIRTSEVIIADASGQNPNVMFELGLCFAAYRFPILLVRHDSELPVNMRALRYIAYTDTDEGLQKLKDELGNTISAFLSATRKRP